MIFIIPLKPALLLINLVYFYSSLSYKMNNKYTKKDKLKNKKRIEKLFTEGNSVLVFPLRLVFLEVGENDSGTKVGVSVSKKHFKSAISRNRIKRLIREVYRLNKSVYFNNITTQYALMILYIGNHKPTFQQINEAMSLLFEKFNKKISES